jgi:hypothetical protein
MEEHWAAAHEDVVRAISHPEVMQCPDKMEGVRSFDWAIPGRNSLAAVFDFDQQSDEVCDERK